MRRLRELEALERRAISLRRNNGKSARNLFLMGFLLKFPFLSGALNLHTCNCRMFNLSTVGALFLMLLNGLSPDISFWIYSETSASASHDNLWLCCIVNHPCHCLSTRIMHSHWHSVTASAVLFSVWFHFLHSHSPNGSQSMYVDLRPNRFARLTRKRSKKKNEFAKKKFQIGSNFTRFNVHHALRIDN